MRFITFLTMSVLSSLCIIFFLSLSNPLLFCFFFLPLHLFFVSKPMPITTVKEGFFSYLHLELFFHFNSNTYRTVIPL